MANDLTGYRILILESREEAQFARLLKEKGAHVLQCPMFTIRDTPEFEPVERWIGRAIALPFDDFVFLTGEGVRRLVKVAHQFGLAEPFALALARARKLARGPKPGRALRDIGLEPQMTAERPTTDGVIEMLPKISLKGHRVGLQLYPEKDHSTLVGALEKQGALVDAVVPYIYDSRAADAEIIAAIQEMAAGRVDALALTNLGQVRRLFEVARAQGYEDRLREGLDRTSIASVGPVVSDELKAHGSRTDIMPAEGGFFMRPLIAAMAAELGKRGPHAE